MIAQNDEKYLDQLFQSYREATESHEVSPHFMPVLWDRIEARRRNSLMVERLARLFATATVALVVVAGFLVSMTPQNAEEDTWVEALANQNLAQNASYYDPVRLSARVDRDFR